MASQVDFGQWWAFYLAPGQEQVVEFSWIMDRDHWQWMTTAPDSPAANVQIVEQWALTDATSEPWVWLGCRFRNNGSTGLVHRPKVVVCPSRY